MFILSCSDKTYSTGITSNIFQRLEDHQHRKHKNSYTASRLPVKLVFYSEFTDPSLAIAKEKQLKKWSRAKKEALINGNYKDLPNLAKRNFRSYQLVSIQPPTVGYST